MGNEHLDFCLSYVLDNSTSYIRRDKVCKYGITSRSHPEEDIPAITADVAKHIYKRDCWDPYRYQDIKDARVAAKILDTSTYLGHQRTILRLQRAVSEITPCPVDGRLGNATIRRVNSLNPDVLLSLFVVQLNETMARSERYDEFKRRIQRVP